MYAKNLKEANFLQHIATLTMYYGKNRGDIINLGRGVKYLMRRATFSTLFKNLQWLCVIKVTWPRPAASRHPDKTTWMGRAALLTTSSPRSPPQGNFSSRHLTVLLRALVTRRPGPGGGIPQWVRAWALGGWELPLPVYEKYAEECWFPPWPRIKSSSFYTAALSPLQTPRKSKVLPEEFYVGEVRGSFPFGWSMILSRVIFQG